MIRVKWTLLTFAEILAIQQGNNPTLTTMAALVFTSKKQKHIPQCGNKPKVSGPQFVIDAETKLAKISPSKREQSQINVKTFRQISVSQCEQLIYVFSMWSKTDLATDSHQISPWMAKTHLRFEGLISGEWRWAGLGDSRKDDVNLGS